jgi:hypothetical protein
MPRLSLYKPTKGNDDKFINKTMSEMFTVGGVDVYVHKYLGPLAQPNTNATEPGGATSITGIQDLLFLENRDRKYDTSVYTIRTIYRINDNDFDLTQFGLFLTGDTMFAVFHYDDMIDVIGRKLMVGDVLEMPNLIDYYPIDEGVGAALKRFYVVQDASRAAEGFAQTYWPHLWRCKLQPLVDSQEYKDILNNLPATDSGDNTNTLGEVISTYNKYIEINDAIVTRAEQDVPKSGYDTTTIYTEAVGSDGLPVDPGALDTSVITDDASDVNHDASAQTLTNTVKVEGYLTGDALPPNGATVAAGIAFPNAPGQGDYYLRLDYIPNRLFRYDGRRWVKVEDAVRTNLTPGSDNKTQLSSFINDDNKFMSNSAAWDAIRVSSTYTPAANAKTLSFTLSTKTVVVKVPYNRNYGVRTKLNGEYITNTISNSSGNIAITITGPLYPRKLRLTSAISTGGNATVTFASQSTTPFVVGQTIQVAGVETATQFNGSWTVLQANASSATYTLAGNLTGTILSATIADGSPLPIGSLLEYTVYRHVVNERQGLSQALRPSADNI